MTQNLLDKAIIFAVERHSGAMRKGSSIPYIVHPMEAVAIAASMTGDPEVLSAVVLHDVVEDTDTDISEIKEKFGAHVARLVSAESEDKMPGIPAAESWRLRKEATIRSLDSASIEEKIIVLSDKLSNIRSLYRDILRAGDQAFNKFNQKDKTQHEWYFRSIKERLPELSGSVAFQEFCTLIDKVFEM